MGTRNWMAACAAALACAWAGSAGATVYTITFSSPGGNSDQFTVDNAKGEPGPGGTWRNDVTGATATLNGVSEVLDPSAASSNFFMSIGRRAPGDPITGSLQIQFFSPTFSTGVDVLALTNVSVGPSGFSADTLGSWAIDTRNPSTGVWTETQFSSPHITISPSPDLNTGVPEPSTWALSIVGLGLVGAAMRRRACTLRVIARAAGA